MQLYDDICKNNIRDYGEKVDKYIKIIINQYSDRTHFIFEIIQNAEDAGATEICFHLFSNRLEIYHNGRPFTEEDVKGICSIAEGTKNDGTQIGHFGIGFKAVYSYTSTPSVYSGDKCFQICGYINPKEIQHKSGLKNTETCFILPFNGDNVTEELAYHEIKDALLNRLSADSIVMLKSIQQMRISIADVADKYLITKNSYSINNSKHVFGMTLTVRKDGNEESKNYLQFIDGEKEASILVFLLDNSERLKAIPNSRIYAFFPTAKESHQGFLIHAPFDTTPARDNFKEGEVFGEHNIKLIKNICVLIQKSFCWLRDSGYLTIDALGKLFPIYQYDKSDILYKLYQNSVEMIANGEKLLPDNSNARFHSINQVCIPEIMAITTVFSDDDLQSLFHKNNIFWLSKEIAGEGLHDLKKFLNANFSIDNLGWKDLIEKMNSSFLESKDRDWYEKLFDAIRDSCGKPNLRQSNYIDVTGVSFIRLSNGTNISAKTGNQLNIFLNNPSFSDYKIDEEFLDSPCIYSFYDEILGVKEFDLIQEIRQSILPKYANQAVAFTTGNPLMENKQDLEKIHEGIYQEPLIKEEASNCYLLTDGSEWYLPKDLHIRSDDTRCGYGLIDDKLNLKYLSEDYRYSFQDDFFEDLGCSKGLALKPVSHNQYLSAAKKYLNHSQYNDISYVIGKEYLQTRAAVFVNYEDFPDIFCEMSLERSEQIMRFLNANASNFDIKGEINGADNKTFSKGVETRNYYTLLGLEICFEKWIYDKDGEGPVKPIDIDKTNLSSAYAPFTKILQKIPFKDNTSKIKELIDTPQLNEKEKEELAIYISSNPDELYKAILLKKRVEAKEAAKKVKENTKLEDLIKGLDKAQQLPKMPSTGPEVSPISKTGIETREENLEKEFTRSLNSNFKVKHGFSFSLKTCTDQEREFLNKEYSGRCQICGTSILKYDGSQYFEAIQIVKRNSLTENQQGTLRLGWNSLCLCPNCAAKYNYCSKDLSNMYEQIMQAKIEADSDEPIGIDITLSNKKETIHYSPRHLMALKIALESSK